MSGFATGWLLTAVVICSAWLLPGTTPDWIGEALPDGVLQAQCSDDSCAAEQCGSGPDSWSLISSEGAPSTRTMHSAVWTGTEMLVWGGGNAKSECLNTGGRYDPVTDRWSPMTLENAPAPRYMMRPDAGVWTGRQFLVVGGYDLNTEFGTSHGWSPAPAMQLYQRVR